MAQVRDERREYLKHVIRHGVVGGLEHGRLRIAVDGDDGLSGGDTHRELTRAAHGAGDGQLGPDDDAGLANLPLAWRPARGDPDARGAPLSAAPRGGPPAAFDLPAPAAPAP